MNKKSYADWVATRRPVDPGFAALLKALLQRGLNFEEAIYFIREKRLEMSK
jgi:hypothetical protein